METRALPNASGADPMYHASVFNRSGMRVLLAVGIVALTVSTIFSGSEVSLGGTTARAKLSGELAIAVTKNSTLNKPDTFNENQEELAAEPTGADLHLSECGVSWERFFSQLPPVHSEASDNKVFQWTISGGEEYFDSLEIILGKWRMLGLDPVLVVALEQETAQKACRFGFSAVHWDYPKASYSRVADAKFGVAASIADRGYRGFFIEMDVFCRENPVPVFLERTQDLVNVGHGDVGYRANIGTFMASPKMASFFRGLSKVLAYSLENEEYVNNFNITQRFFDQDVFQHCLPRESQNQDDDVSLDQYGYYLLNDTQWEDDLIRHCQGFNFSYTILPHHVMSNYNPPVIFDSTICIHPLAAAPFTPLAYKIGAAKFRGWDPKPIGADEKLIKLTAGDLEANNCWSQVVYHADRLNRFNFYHNMAMMISALVELADRTNRTVVLPQYYRDKESWALPVHGVLNVRTLGVPYRFMTPEQAHRLRKKDVAVMYAASTFNETLHRAEDKKYENVKILSIMKICNLREYKNNVLEERRKAMGWCYNSEQTWARVIGSWLNFCDADPQPNANT